MKPSASTQLSASTSSGTNSSDFSDTKFKFNATWQYADDQRAYFTFSQGFRRGGANAMSLTGFLREPASILNYNPDSVDNYELGLKGRLFDDWTYTADVFIGKWHDPQIGGFTAVNFWPAVFNGKEAESKGFEGEVSGHLSEELSFTAGYSYTEAKLTEDFCVPSGDGTGNPNGNIPCAINGSAGTPLPSAPKHSGTFSLNYEQPIGVDDTLTATFNANYKGESFQNLPTLGQRYFTIPDYWLVNLYLGWEHGPITTSLYVRNALDERIVYSQNARITSFAPIDLYTTVGRPRSMGVEVSYKF
ncbi:MAG: TonB-dependent receptor [Hyphomonadaceae bacterium]